LKELKRTSRPPTSQEIEETNHRDPFDKYLHGLKYLNEYHVPEWVWERAERKYWGNEGGESLFFRNSGRMRSI
jgi:hypothetical protein